MRAETDRAKLKEFMTAFGGRVRGPGRIYLTEGATALLQGWRSTTIDIDIKADPEPAGMFEAVAVLKDDLDVNVKVTSPDDFIPAVPGWQERSLHISRHGPLDFYHYDLYSQALSKLQRGHERDITDVRAMLRDGFIRVDRLLELFELIGPQLIRYPAIDAAVFRCAVTQFCNDNR